MELEADHAGITEVLERSKCTIKEKHWKKVEMSRTQSFFYIKKKNEIGSKLQNFMFIIFSLILES